MALTAHTRWPRNLDGTRSEYRLARLLEQLLPDGSHGWFDLKEFGQRQIDILLWVPEVGFVVVEVKGHRLDQVRWAGNGTPVFHGSTEHPVDQASAGGYQLKQRLEQAGGRPLGRWTFTAALPNIRRDDWLRARDREDLADESLAMVFGDDLAAPDLLLRVLERARLAPPRAAAPARIEPPPASPPGWALRLLSPVPATRRADDADLRAIGEADTSRFPPGEGWRVVFRGYPGTGKTTHLLGLALQHVALGRRVLFLSHNKVLSAHVRAWAESLLAEWGMGRDRIQVAHSTGYLKARRTRWDLDLGSFDERAADAVRSVPLLGGDDAFDTLLLDEAQDAAGWVRELMLRSSKDGSDWFLGYGPSQALYASDSAWVDEVAASGQVVQLRRSWRSRDWAFIEAQAFYECAPATGELEAWLPLRWPPRPRPDRTGTIDLFDVDVETTGGPFVLRGLNDDDLAQFDESHPAFPVVKKEVVAREVSLALEQLDDEMKPGDTLLILVPHVAGSLTAGAREAVAAWGDRWQDMTSDLARDQYGSQVPVTLSTYHSARGLQADHVLILGIEELAGLASEAADEMEHVRRLGYLALSRARVTTTVLVPQSTRDPHVEFLRELTARMRMLRPDTSVTVVPVQTPTPELPPWKPCTITAWKDSAGWIRDGEESQRQYPVAGDRLLGVRPSRVTSGMKLHYLPQAGSLGVRLLAHQIHRWFDLTSEGLSFVRVRHRNEETGDGVGVGLHDDRDVIIAADLMKQLDLQPGSTAQLTIEDAGVTWRATGGRRWPVED